MSKEFQQVRCRTCPFLEACDSEQGRSAASGLQYWGRAERCPVAKIAFPASYKEVHMTHCYQNEYPDSCKYGDENCPAKSVEAFWCVVCNKPLKKEEQCTCKDFQKSLRRKAVKNG